MLTVGLFSNQFASQAGHGIARYSRELVDALRAMGGIRPVPVAGWSSLPTEELADLRKSLELRLTGLGRRGTALCWTFLGAPGIERLVAPPLDVVHALSLGYPVATRKPFVVTVHDLGPLTHPEYFRNTRPWVMAKSLAQANRKADVIVCVSASTANEVEGYVGGSVGQRIRIVHEGVAPRFFEPVDPVCLAGLDLPPPDTPIILSAGAISPRKNVQGVIKALQKIHRDVPHHLVLVGGAGWDIDVVDQELQGSPEIRERVHFLGFVSDLQLRGLYARAAVYVHPSLYEGFGLTVLEAMAAGTPVVASDRTSLPEVVGDAGRLVDPTDSDALAAEIREICLNRENAELGVNMRRAHAATFTWEGCAREMAEAYAGLAR